MISSGLINHFTKTLKKAQKRSEPFIQFTPQRFLTLQLSTFPWAPRLFPQYKYPYPPSFLTPKRNKEEKKNSNTFKNLYLSLLVFVTTILHSFHLYIFHQSWHLKQFPSSPSPLLFLWRFSSPPPPPLRTCLRRRRRDPMPGPPEPFRARSP